MDSLKNYSYWNEDKTEWKQPPVKIKHGDLVEIEYGEHNTVLGRYVGKGKGVAIIPDYSKGDTFHIGIVKHRGLNLNPRIVSDEELFNFIED